MWTTFQPHIQATADAAGLEVTRLFDQAALDAAVAAERERLTKALRKHVLTYQVDDDAWDREAAADRAVARLLNVEANRPGKARDAI